MTSPTPMLAEPVPPAASATPVREGASPASRTGIPARTPGGSPTPPGVRTTADLLDDLAAAHLRDEADEEFAAGVLIALQLLGEIAPRVDIWLAFEDLAEAVRRRDGIATGVLHWSEVADDLTCGDPSEAAHDIACGRVADAVSALLGGGR